MIRKSVEELLKESNDDYANWYEAIVNMKLKDSSNE
jgi:hypothetical protein